MHTLQRSDDRIRCRTLSDGRLAERGRTDPQVVESPRHILCCASARAQAGASAPTGISGGEATRSSEARSSNLSWCAQRGLG